MDAAPAGVPEGFGRLIRPRRATQRFRGLCQRIGKIDWSLRLVESANATSYSVKDREKATGAMFRFLSKDQMYNDGNQSALENLRHAIDWTRKLPENVFSDAWNQFLFFDSDRIFASQFHFVDQVKTLLEIENGKLACMVNLDEVVSGKDVNHCAIFVNPKMTDEEYISLLQGPTVAEAWIYNVDRFGCTSDVGQWCIYFERRNEIAIIAFQEQNALAKYASVIAQLGALTLNRAIEKPPSYAFTPNGVAWKWRDELLKVYG
jgi:hypothetical protein